ncbi:potassium channel subfamily K member 13 [Cololabis saira]|uniref:potassium channel subfamily K member 13 n=1 Tax=Cololabis saira TaxID=129043 RepID=UPI002AD37554|nr:potassium channel subfamily K member 13 [Cololabis saira]
MSVRKGFLCCCLFLIPSRETARFYLLATLILLYMLAGAALFSSLERPAELKAHQLWEMRLRIFSKEHNITREALKSLLRHYEEARTAGIHTKRDRAVWDIPGAFYFVGTVVSTIGFGVAAPSTTAGKFLIVFYGLLGCSASILFFNLFLERVITFLSFWMLWFRTRRSIQRGLENRLSGNYKWISSVYLLTLILLFAALLLVCAAASLYSAMEGWSYLDSLYFCFVAFSTVGFGDFVSGQRAHYEGTWTYKMANCLLMLLGVCCTYSLFNAFAVIIKKVLNWILSSVNSIYIFEEMEGEPMVGPGQIEDDMGKSEQDVECFSVQESEVTRVRVDRASEKQVTTDPAETKQHTVNFYTDLFRADVCDAESTAALLLGLPRLSPEDQEILNEDISLAELTSAVGQMASVVDAWQTLKVTRTPDPRPGMWLFEKPLFYNDFLNVTTFSSATLRKNNAYEFPSLSVSPAAVEWQEESGHLLSLATPVLGSFSACGKKQLYHISVKVLNIRSLAEVKESRWGVMR